MMSFSYILENPIKAVLCEGTITLSKKDGQMVKPSDKFRTRISLEYMDIRTGVWNVALKDIHFVRTTAPVRVNFIFNIATNFVEGKKLNLNNLVEHYYPPIQRVLYSYSSANFLSCQPLIWFVVTSKSQDFDLIFDVWPDSEFPDNTESKFQVTATVLFQRRQ